MKNFTVYSPMTGEILRQGSCDDPDFVHQAGPGEAILEGREDDLTHYVLGGVLTPRPPMPFSVDKTSAVEEELVTFSGLPAGVEVEVSPPGSRATVPDGTLALTFGMLGQYKITMRLFPYRDGEVTVGITG